MVLLCEGNRKGNGKQISSTNLKTFFISLGYFSNTGNYSFWKDTFGLDKTTYKLSLIATVVQFNPDQLNELNENSPDWKDHMVNHAYFTCLHPLLQLLSALNCSNVEIKDDKENIPSKTKQIMRKYKTGKQIWINSMAVGLKSNTVVEKFYSVK